MISCPNCSNQLPDWAQKCQFCDSDVKAVARPKPTPDQVRRAAPTTAKWIWPAYYIVAGYFILSGIQVIATGITLLTHTKDGPLAGTLQIMSYVTMGIGAFTALVGFGLILKNELARGIVNVLCWIRIVISVIGLFGSLLAGGFVGPIALVVAFFEVLDILTAALMIYLLGETD